MPLRMLKNLQNLSLDVVLGAITMSWLFARGNGVQVPEATYLILGIAVWLVYTLDHLLDARRIKREAQTARHRFHQKHVGSLIAAWLTVLTIGLILSIRYLPSATWRWGSIVLFFLVIYFVSIHFFHANHANFGLKEVGVAWGYATGVAVGPLSLMTHFTWMQVLSFFLLFIIALFNLVMFSFFEFRKDVRQGHASIATSYGRSRTAIILNGIFLAALILGAILLLTDSGNPYFYLLNGYLLFISVFYYLMIRSPKHMNKAGLYRILGDGVFVAPLILIAIGQL